MTTFILVLVLSTSSFDKSGAGAISQEFNSESTCLAAGKALTQQASERNNYVLAWGCFRK